jgi:aminoglycoside 3-N-acetyltransferase
MLKKTLMAIAKRVLPKPARNHIRRLQRQIKKTSWAINPRETEDAEGQFRTVIEHLQWARGKAVLVHSASEELAQSGLSAIAIIGILEEYILPEGTLLMPAFPFGNDFFGYINNNQTYDVRKTPSRAGIITEIFRRMPGVVRSMHPTHPVCAKGKMAIWFTEAHNKDPTPYGSHSPFAKLVEQDGLVAGFGFSPDHISNIHTFEDRLGDQFPYRVYNEEPYIYTLTDKDGRTLDYQGLVHNAMSTKHDISILIRTLIEKDQLIQVDFKNMPCFSIRAKHIDQALESLLDEGITLYGKRKKII